MFISKTTASAALVMSVLLTGSAAASTVSLDAVGSNPFENANGKKAWVVQTSFNLGAETVLLRDVGMYRLEATREDGSTQRLRAVGLQPLEDIQFPIVYDLDAEFSASVKRDLNTLAKNAWSKVDNNRTSAAFQLAAWEIANETGEYDIDDGFFEVIGDSPVSDRAEETAQRWLDNISSGRWGTPNNEFDIVSADSETSLLANRKDLELQVVPRSRKQLQHDHVDLLYLHRFDDDIPLEETFSTLAEMQHDGLFRYIGVSNYAAWQVIKAQAVAQSFGTRIDVIQPMYNLVKRQAEVEIIPMAQDQGIKIVPYSPLGGGLLTGKYAQGETGRLTEDDRYAARYGQSWMHDAAATLAYLAGDAGAAPATLAVAWVAAHNAAPAPIISARSVAQLGPSLAAASFDMTPDLYDALTALTPTPPPATDRLEEA